MPESDIERPKAVAADAWERWPDKTAAGDAARRSHVRVQLSGEMSYTLMERYDAAHAADALSGLINWLLALAQPEPQAMNTYSVETHNDGRFRVRVTNPDRNWHVITGFASEFEVEQWA